MFVGSIIYLATINSNGKIHHLVSSSGLCNIVQVYKQTIDFDSGDDAIYVPYMFLYNYLHKT
ncbi:hypothetical protein BLOT_009319 [Blomia tropicalis]|nr:hypothetical protein BLOT_009319 [Blomia tropicalis]